MSEFQAGEVVVPVVPDAGDFAKKLKKQLVGQVMEIGRSIGQELTRGITEGIGDPLEPLKEETRKQQQRAPKDGEQIGGAFARGFKSRLEAAFKSLPKAEITADSSAAERSVSELRARMQELSGKTIGIDIDAGAAIAEVSAIQRELSAIDGKTVSADVRLDIATALGELAAIRAEVDSLDGRTANVRVDVDVSGALSAVSVLAAALGGLAAIPVAASIGAGLAALSGPLAAAAAGLGGVAAIAGPSLGRINEALKEQKQAAESAATGIGVATGAVRNLVIEQAQARIKALQAAGAQEQLKSAIDRVKTASEAVKAARQRLADVEASAAARVEAALARVAQAEQSVADAQRDAQRAQEDLNKARVEAAQDIEDLGSRLANAQLDIRDANLDLNDAQAALNKTLANPKATAEQKARAQLNYDRAVQRVKDLNTEIGRLQKEQAAADANGVEGSDRVKAAKERVEDATKRVAEAERDVIQARKDADAAAKDGGKQIAAAKAQIKAAEKQVEAAKAAVRAQERQIEIAKLQDKIAKERAKDAAKAATAPVAKAAGGGKFAKLSPAAQKAAKQVKAFQDAYLKWQEKLEPAVLPVITGALKLMQRLFGPLTPLIRGSAKALTGLEKSASKALGGDFWKSFFEDLATAAPKAITGLGKSFGNIIKGVTGFIKAFLPFTGTVIGGIEGATKKFAAFGEGFGKSKGFQSFLAYARENGPKVIQVVKNLFTIVKNLISGLSGSGSGALDVVVSITNWLASLSPETLRTFALAVLGVVVAFKAWKTISTAVDAVKKSIETAKTVVGGAKAAWSGLGKAATGSAKLVKGAASGIASAAKGIAKGAGKAGTAVWTGIRTAASKAASVAKTSGTAIATAAKRAGSAAAKGGVAAWNGIRTAAAKAGAAAKVAGRAIVSAGKTAALAAVNLAKVAWQYAQIAIRAAVARARSLLFAAAQGIVKVATIAWTVAQRILNLVLSMNPIGLIITAIGLLVAAVIVLWNKFPPFRQAVEAAWKGIQIAVQWAWENVIRPAFQAIWGFIRDTLAPIFVWLWNNVIVPAWKGISAAIQWAWNNVILPAVKAGYVFFKTVLGPVFGWLWNTIIKPAWQGLSAAIKFAWNNVILPAVKAGYKFFKETLAPAFTWLWKTIIIPAWNGIKTAITTVWTSFLKPTFDKLYDVIFKTIPDGFKKGVSLIETAWNKVKDVAKKPVKFLVDTVYTGGIKKVWDTVAKALGLSPLPPVTFAAAKGGIYPGYTPGKDVGLAAVSGGEAIMRPEWTRAVGEKYVHGANAAARSGGVGGVAKFLGVAGDPGPGFAGAFAGGGIVGNIKEALAGGIKAGAEKLLNPLLDQAQAAMGDSQFGKLLVGVPRKMVKDVVEFLGKKEGNGGKAVAYARQQIGKPYQWGATGPSTFDCSGLTMRALQSAGITGVPRVSQEQMKWVKPVTSPLPGDLGFPHPGHVWMYSAPGKIIEAPHTGAKVREVAARSAQVMGRAPQLFDNGGYLPTGESLVYNGTGRPEPVLTDRQWEAVGSQTRGGDGGLTIQGDFIAQSGQSPQQIVDALSWRRKAKG